MRKTIFITGVTRMRNGFVCVSGIDSNGDFVRPEISYPERKGIKNDYLFVSGDVVIKPLVKVELNFLRPTPKSAFHTEDWLIDGTVPPKLISEPSGDEIKNILSENSDKSLDDALHDQSRSLIIVRAQGTPQVRVNFHDGRLKSHLSFYDESGKYHDRLPVTDCNWLASVKYLWKNDRLHLEQRLERALSHKKVYMRIGITREWKGQRWRQISGVFSVPDWLKGRCFADFGYDFSDEV